MEFHEVVSLFPPMTADEFKDLVASIRTEGLREPIWTHEGKIIDGRHRYLACREANVEPRYRQWDGKGSMVTFVVAMNMKRRHLTASQKAMVSADMLPLLAKEARERQAHGQTAPGKTLTPRMEEAFKGEAAEKAAAITGAGRQYVYDAKSLIQKAPDLAQQVRSGEKTLTQAKREVKQRKLRESAPPPPVGKYRVLYADPPWKYSDALDISKDGLGESYGSADAHYPQMSITELCGLPIRDLAEENAVLFMWTTSPLLEESFKVINAWGFRYKASFVWDKVKHNMGHYNSVRHEFLLVCTRSSCTPDERRLFDSVQSVERTEHSTKPEEFRTIIETLYTHGNRIELFARRRYPGWDAWGNEL